MYYLDGTRRVSTRSRAGIAFIAGLIIGHISARDRTRRSVRTICTFLASSCADRLDTRYQVSILRRCAIHLEFTKMQLCSSLASRDRNPFLPPIKKLQKVRTAPDCPFRGGYCGAIAVDRPRKMYFWIFPVAVLGSSLTKVTLCGALK